MKPAVSDLVISGFNKYPITGKEAFREFKKAIATETRYNMIFNAYVKEI